LVEVVKTTTKKQRGELFIATRIENPDITWWVRCEDTSCFQGDFSSKKKKKNPTSFRKLAKLW
jgi:hypothetical protein